MPDYTEAGAALRAEKVIAQARKIIGPEIIELSSKHRGRKVVLKDSVYCVIATPLKALRNKRR